MKKSCIILNFALPILLLTSCDQDSSDGELQYILDNSDLPFDSRIDFLKTFYDLKYNQNYEDVTCCASNDGAPIEDGIGTLFYFKKEKNVGFRTSRMEYGYNVLGHQIGSPAYNYVYGNRDGLFPTLEKRGWTCSAFNDEMHFRIENDDAMYDWYKFEYKNLEKLELYVAIESNNDLHRIGIFDIRLND